MKVWLVFMIAVLTFSLLVVGNAYVECNEEHCERQLHDGTLQQAAQKLITDADMRVGYSVYLYYSTEGN